MVYRDNYSKGCCSCQEGRWLCIFITYLCDANCYFCPAPIKGQDKVISAFGDDPSVIQSYIQNSDFNGISFSGGDCFLVFDRLRNWLTFFKKHFPDFYFWAYTNGIHATEDNLQELADSGLNELRFNIAATGYNNAHTLKIIEKATRLFKHVSVEIPSIPEDHNKLIGVLPYLDTLGVLYLNLHEYIITPNLQDKFAGASDTFVLNKTMKLPFDKASKLNTDRVIVFCRENDLNIQVNNCSLQKKESQMLQRRLKMGQLLKSRFEQLNPSGFLEAYYACPTNISSDDLETQIQSIPFEQLKNHFFDPDELDYHLNQKTHHVAKLSFIPPLSIRDKRILFQVEVLTEKRGQL